jgi:hypothetical protein
MAAKIAQIECVKKTDRNNPWERITHVGGRSGNGWKITQEVAIGHIESGEWSFFVSVRGDRVDVIVATSRFGNKYLKTRPDGDQPNNLLSLPECP